MSVTKGQVKMRRGSHNPIPCLGATDWMGTFKEPVFFSALTEDGVISKNAFPSSFGTSLQSCEKTRSVLPLWPIWLATWCDSFQLK
jgi:hypothetical protein